MNLSSTAFDIDTFSVPDEKWMLTHWPALIMVAGAGDAFDG